VGYGKVPFPVNDDENDFGAALDSCSLFERCHRPSRNLLQEKAWESANRGTAEQKLF